MSDLLMTPPQDLDAEKSLLGAMMISRTAVDSTLLTVNADDFFGHSNQIVFRVIVALHEQGTGIDAVTLGKTLSAEKNLEEIGGVQYLGELMESVPHAYHAEYYAKIVKEHSLRRSVILTGHQAIREAYDLGSSIDDVVTNAEGAIHSLIERQASGDQEETITDVLSDAFNNIGQAKKRGIPTGFGLLDQWTFGLQPALLTILAARPSIGKTAMACNLALNSAHQGHAVAYFSLEQPRIQLAERLLATESGIDSNKLKSGDLHEAERHRIMEAANRLSELPLFLDDKPKRTVSTISARCRLLKRRQNLKLVIIDYLQLLKAASDRVPREQQVARMSQDCAILGRELDVTVMVLCQFNRAAGARSGADRAPRLSDLRESGSLEQDGRVIMLLDRPYTYDPTNNQIGDTVLHLAKNSEGQTGKLKLTMQMETGKFIEQDEYASASGFIDNELNFGE